MKVFFTVTSLLVFLYWQDRTGGEIRDTNVGSWGPIDIPGWETSS